MRTPIFVWADWHTLKNPQLMGILYSEIVRGDEIFSFEYDQSWLKSKSLQILDPNLQHYTGLYYAPGDRDNFGLFLDSSPDRWGRFLMQRREAQLARTQKRKEQRLMESDYLLGVHDSHRIGALRFKLAKDGPFMDNNSEMASPPWASLRELERISLNLEQSNASEHPEYSSWLKMLIAPGGSLGGARPKASVTDDHGNLWIAKFPSSRDRQNTGLWEELANVLARKAGIKTAETQIQQFASEYHTFLSKRFDRTGEGKRIHFASAMTLLNYKDGDCAATGVSYLDMVEFLRRSGSSTNQDLEELWKRIVFFICISNTDDHLRNHGFLLNDKGWSLAPAYDINPTPNSYELKLNISETDNSLDLSLALEVAEYFHVRNDKAKEIVSFIMKVVKTWRKEAQFLGLTTSEQDEYASAFEKAILPKGL